MLPERSVGGRKEEGSRSLFSLRFFQCLCGQCTVDHPHEPKVRFEMRGKRSHHFSNQPDVQGVWNLPLFKFLEALGLVKTKSLFDILFRRFDPIIDDHKETLDRPCSSPRDFVDCFLAEFYGDGGELEEEESRTNIRNVILDLFVGGIETTGTSLTW